jgi:hypothetical protein
MIFWGVMPGCLVEGYQCFDEPVFPVSRVEEHGSMFLNNIVTHVTGNLTLHCAQNMTVIPTVLTTSVLTQRMFVCFESYVLDITN